MMAAEYENRWAQRTQRACEKTQRLWGSTDVGARGSPGFPGLCLHWEEVSVSPGWPQEVGSHRFLASSLLSYVPFL